MNHNLMYTICQVLFWTSVLAVIHSYLIYPIILSVLKKTIPSEDASYTESDELPTIAILLAAYNEEEVIQQKITSTFDTNYPLSKITLFIGSDASKDNTDAIIETAQQDFPQIKFKRFPGRSGKIQIINELAKDASADIFVLTDANVFFHRDTLFELVRYYKDSKIDLIAGNIQNSNIKQDGISQQEQSYLHRENIIKEKEGAIWGATMGAFGGVFSMRASAFQQVPNNFIVDDFYLTMKVIQSNKYAITNLNAQADEDVSNNLSDEFKRKVRISAGNFQNLAYFKNVLFQFNRPGVSFAFWSHKVLRWMGPFFILTCFIANLFLYNYCTFYKLTLFAQLGLFTLPLLDYLFSKANVHVKLLRYIRHFYSMNIALLLGFVKFSGGIKSSTWTPTKRNQ